MTDNLVAYIKEEVEGIQATIFHAFLEAKCEGLFVPIAEIGGKVNEELEERERISNATIGRQLKALGFKLGKQKRIRGVFSDPDFEKLQLERYPLTMSESPSRRPSQSSNKGTEGQWGRFWQGVEDNRESRDNTRDTMRSQSQKPPDAVVISEGGPSR
jgi:hypothetical protein